MVKNVSNLRKMYYFSFTTWIMFESVKSWLLKVSKFQNELMKSLFLPKYERKFVRISALTKIIAYKCWLWTIMCVLPDLRLFHSGISKWIYKAIVSPKIWRNIYKDFCLVVCHTVQGRNPCNFSFIFWEKQWLHKFILKFTDL